MNSTMDETYRPAKTSTLVITLALLLTGLIVTLGV